MIKHFSEDILPQERLPKTEIIQDLPQKTKGRKWLSMFKNFTFNSDSLVILFIEEILT